MSLINCPKSQFGLKSLPLFRMSCLCVLLLGAVLDAPSVSAQGFGGFGGFQNVGGVRVDGQGVIQDIRPQLREDLAGTRQQLEADVPDNLPAGVQLRKISLRALQESLLAAANQEEQLPEAVRYLSGLQRVQYVFVYPEQQDIVLAGPGEAWRINELGQAVGATNGRPVIHLQDLMVALRNAFNADGATISCSIEPTPEGILNLQSKLNQFGRLSNRGQIRQVVSRKQELEESLGPQDVILTGVDPTSRFAWTLVAADYRMKCLGMGLESAPIAGMPSYPEIMRQRSADLMPRWWMETDYDALLTDEAGFSWELRGQGVKVLAEDELVMANGERKPTGKVNQAARRWAETMTEKYDELSIASPIFGQLRNCMDLAVVAALIHSKSLDQKAGLALTGLLDEKVLTVPSGAVPRSTPSIVSFLERRRSLVITASGGVLIQPWKVVEQTEQSPELAAMRSSIESGHSDASDKNWYWD